MKKKIPYGKQLIDKLDINSVVSALNSELITSGPKVDKFENLFKKKVGSKFAVSCVNGTAALHLSLLGINLKKNDIVIMPVINFIAVANMANNLGAKIFFADVDPFTAQMTPDNLEECIKKNKLKKIKAVVTMYNGGKPNNALEFYKLKKKYSFYLIEDACHALGAKYSIKKKLYVGSCKYSDISTFSFHAIKNITTCEGGMITTNNSSINNLIKLYKNHGIVRKASSDNKYFWDYQVVKAGFNYRLNDIQSALGISQLKKLNNFIKQRKKISHIYNKNLTNLKKYINCPIIDKDQVSGHHLYVINFKFNKKDLRNKAIKFLYKKGIISQVHYIPIYKFNYYKKICKGDFSGAEKYYKNSLSLPNFVSLKEKQILFICKTLSSFIKNNHD